jgi:Holliday junction resolvase RusA-like endonuclease
MIHKFTIPGNPVGKARPRFNSQTNRTYTPQETRDYEELVKWSYRAKYSGKMLTGEISAAITAYYKIPDSWSKKRKEQAVNGELKPTVKPDCDNVVKAILDAINGVAYKDDAAVTDLEFHKRYTISNPRVEVIISGND